MSADHDRTFIRTFLAVLGVLVGFTFVIIFVARGIMSAVEPEGLPEARAERIAKRTQPVFQVITDPAEAQKVAMASGGEGNGGGASAPEDPEKVYKQVCATCHDSGVSGAPKTGDAGAWEPRIAKGKDTLYKHAIEGFNMMPAKGGNAALSDQAVKGSVDYMIEKSGG